ncbi:MAG TPA: BON domain-containing protein [Myxococcota bacterium]|nr:BON domain-containing protein [Myxococcota bacterium]
MSARRYWLAFGVTAALSLSAPAFGAAASDPWITTKVKTVLLTAEDVDGLDVNVDTVDGQVTLHGRASTGSEKERAAALARSVDGVREVRNLIQVVPDRAEKTVSATDEELKDRLGDKLAREPELADVEVRSVTKGVVVLGGKTPTLSAHLRALEVARDTDGVHRVESQIESPDRLADEEIWKTPDVAAAPGGARSAASDMWITSAAKVRLLGADVSALDVNVDTRNGEVTLFGMVPTDAEKQRAEAEVKKVEGVRAVHNELQVVPEARRDVTERGDEQIQQDVKQRVQSRVGRDDIGVEVANGVVRLSGTVASQGERLAALTAARSSQGVRSVVGDLRVERN